MWSPDGGELFYRTPNGEALVAVRIERDPTVSASAPMQLFAGAYQGGISLVGAAEYDIDPNGDRFLMLIDRHGAGGARLG